MPFVAGPWISASRSDENFSYTEKSGASPGERLLTRNQTLDAAKALKGEFMTRKAVFPTLKLLKSRAITT
ncbi:hypothetical protein [Dickeya dianthicola]|uniref:hypothetical protein n=1 Tax=Dickeya dianthicola TaxID=204039 RepID=UPI00039D4953|nr:hypothetical protein [Dickeya dianthicola]ATO34783.1 hypothetical protein DDI_3615 [Dickeya dianthicola RNS04.9]MBT1429582.1 hypothetical protein [Dickeya dianthicola]MBT1433608.1 hypothetical protein [Dickeya dianthicola]MBT1461098.1 hypothetical protein [Dickeya dianthicola]MBT1490293.1 hypothetical protein [Dickeya dianthicola]